MQLFAKRRSGTSSSGAKVNPTKAPEEEVVSYFAKSNSNDLSNNSGANRKKKKQSAPTHSIEELKALDPATLNAKQRRLLKRSQERDSSEIEIEEQKLNEKGKDDKNEKNNNENSAKQERVVEDKSSNDVRTDESTCEVQIEPSTETTLTESTDGLTEEQVKMLEGLNSKERRKLKRQFEREQLDSNVSTGSQNDIINASEAPKKKSKKVKDFSHLPPAERERREKQREMQRLAAEQRANGDATNKLHAHPLNSERRRANRRKPGKTVKMAMMRQEAKERRIGMAQYNAYGYNMRKKK